MTDDDHQPTPAAVCPRRPSPPPQPYRIISAAGRPLIVHPGVCYVCRKPPHPDRPDHRFEPAVEDPARAAMLRWI